MRTTLEDILKTPSSGSDENQLVKRSIQLLQNWPWVLVSTGLCLSIAFIYLRYTTPVYEITATLLVKDDTKGTDLGEAAIMENLGLSSGQSNVDNEVEILKSRMLMEKVVQDLQLFTTCFVKGNIKTTELFDQSPVMLHFIENPVLAKKHTQKVYTVQFLEHDSLEISATDKSWIVAPGDTLLLPEGKVIVRPGIKRPDNDNTYEITISGLRETVRKYSQALRVSATNKQVSIITLKLTDLDPVKGEAILNRLIANYLQVSQADKNRIAEQTISFIKDNLDTVSREVASLEQQMEQFRRSNQLADLTEQSRILLTDLAKYDAELNEVQSQLHMAESLLQFIKSNTNEPIPSSVILQQPVFLATISKYNEIQLLKERAKRETGEAHPLMQGLNKQVADIKQELIRHIESRRSELDIIYKANTRVAGTLKSQMGKMPTVERTFFDLKRQLQIKQDLHTFLLKKQIETSISRSSNLPNGRIIDAPMADYNPTSPDKQITILLALLSGILIPVIFLCLRDIFNVRLSSKKELVDKVKAPLIGEIEFQQGPLFQFDRNTTAEQFRTLRTNLQFIVAGQKNKVILITSGMSEEGKTFVATNLCQSLHLSGKTVLLADFDLRRPQVGKTLHLQGKGISDYAISSAPLNAFIQNYDNKFSVITAGIIPPNPAELIESARIAQAITELKEQYDYVIIDSPPFELVTDAKLLSQYADLTLYVVRQNFTFRHQLEAIQHIYETDQLPKLHIILNNAKRATPYGYTYGAR